MDEKYKYVSTTKAQLKYEEIINRERTNAAQRVATEKDRYFLYVIKRRQCSGDMNHQSLGGCLSLKSSQELVDRFRKLDESKTVSYWIEVDTILINAKIRREMAKEKKYAERV